LQYIIGIYQPADGNSGGEQSLEKTIIQRTLPYLIEGGVIVLEILEAKNLAICIACCAGLLQNCARLGTESASSSAVSGIWKRLKRARKHVPTGARKSNALPSKSDRAFPPRLPLPAATYSLWCSRRCG